MVVPPHSHTHTHTHARARVPNTGGSKHPRSVFSLEVALYFIRFMLMCAILMTPSHSSGRDRIAMLKKLGAGAFGDVFLGLYNPPAKNLPEMKVAIKTLKAGSNKEERDDLMKEAIVSVQFDHPNIVKAIGVVTGGSPAMLVLELCSRGELQGILKDAANPGIPGVAFLTRSHKRKYCHDIVKGMAYLAHLSIVHRCVLLSFFFLLLSQLSSYPFLLSAFLNFFCCFFIYARCGREPSTFCFRLWPPVPQPFFFLSFSNLPSYSPSSLTSSSCLHHLFPYAQGPCSAKRAC